jgi:hypothetical protein
MERLDSFGDRPSRCEAVCLEHAVPALPGDLTSKFMEELDRRFLAGAELPQVLAADTIRARCL